MVIDFTFDPENEWLPFTLRYFWLKIYNHCITIPFVLFLSLEEGQNSKPQILLYYSPVAKSWLIWKDPDAGKDWGLEKKGTTEDEMVGQHHRLNGHWAWASSRRWWRTGKPGMLQFMGSQRLRHDWATEQPPSLPLILNEGQSNEGQTGWHLL